MKENHHIDVQTGHYENNIGENGFNVQILHPFRHLNKINHQIMCKSRLKHRQWMTIGCAVRSTKNA